MGVHSLPTFVCNLEKSWVSNGSLPFGMEMILKFSTHPLLPSVTILANNYVALPFWKQRGKYVTIL